MHSQFKCAFFDFFTFSRTINLKNSRMVFKLLSIFHFFINIHLVDGFIGNYRLSTHLPVEVKVALLHGKVGKQTVRSVF